MIAMTLDQIAAAVHGRLDDEHRAGGGSMPVGGIATDTRRVCSGDLFFALDGAHFRGSDFLAEAFRAGAVAAVSTRSGPVAGPVIVVGDADQALIDLGSALRARLGAQVVAITGSNGKTTTKDALGAVLGGRFTTVAAEGSFNNRVGLPLTIARADARTEALVLEVGTSLPGEIARLAAVARPHHAVFTSIGPSHLEGLGSVAGVLEEKLHLLDGLEAGGLVVINGDDPMLALPGVAERVRAVGGRLLRVGLTETNDLRAIEPDWSGGELRFRLSPSGPLIVAALPGRHNLVNLLAVAAVARELGMSEAEIALGMKRVKASRWRMEERELDGVSYILDCYNANPASMAVALRHLRERRHAGRRIAILGDMLELGAESVARHEQIGLTLLDIRPDLVVMVGRAMRAAAEVLRGSGIETIQVDDAEQARAELRLALRTGDLVLLKGSRGLRLERILGEGA